MMCKFLPYDVISAETGLPIRLLLLSDGRDFHLPRGFDKQFACPFAVKDTMKPVVSGNLPLSENISGPQNKE
jgi:hypothetical protein